jgi:hypothetical protein
MRSSEELEGVALVDVKEQTSGLKDVRQSNWENPWEPYSVFFHFI